MFKELTDENRKLVLPQTANFIPVSGSLIRGVRSPGVSNKNMRGFSHILTFSWTHLVTPAEGPTFNALPNQ